MKRRKLSISIVLISGFLCHACFAQSSKDLRDTIVEQLANEGYSKIEISKTLLGRIKIEADGRLGEREIIISPNGQILRDRFQSYTDLSDQDAERLIEEVEQAIGRSLSNKEIENILDEFEDGFENLTEEDLQDHLDEMDEDESEGNHGDENDGDEDEDDGDDDEDDSDEDDSDEDEDDGDDDDGDDDD